MEESNRIREHEKEMAKLSLTIAGSAASASPPIGDTFRVENASKLLPKLRSEQDMDTYLVTLFFKNGQKNIEPAFYKRNYELKDLGVLL